MKDPIQSAAKLHGFAGREFNGGSIDTEEGVVYDKTGATVSLWDTPQWGESELREVSDRFVGQDNPVAFFSEVGHFFSNEGVVFQGGAVGTTRGKRIDMLFGPGRIGSNHRHT